jgi:hypothetical protein
MRALAFVALALASCTSALPAVATPSPTPEPGVLAVTALLDLSGPRAAVGTQQRNALQMWLDLERSRSGASVKLRTVDVASSDARLLIELRRAAVDDPADAVIVGPPAAYDDTLGRALEVASLPVLFTQPLAADPAGRTGGRWAFALAPSLARIAAHEVDDTMRRGVLTPSLVLTDGRERIDPALSAFAAEVEHRGLDPLTRIAMPADGSVPPVVRSSLSVLRSVHCMAPLASCSAVAREARAIGSPAMIYLSYATTPAEIRDDRDLTSRAIWPSSRTLIPPGVLRTATDRARAEFLKAYGERHGSAWPPAQAAAAYDAMSRLVAAADRVGVDDRGALRDGLERITMPLIASTYAFAPDRHTGPDPDDLAYLRATGSAVVLAPLFGSLIATPPTPSPTRPPSPYPSTAP